MSGCGCGALMRKISIELSDPVDVHVQAVGPAGVAQHHPGFPVSTWKCPHGVTWASQPTAWQRRDWELRRVL